MLLAWMACAFGGGGGDLWLEVVEESGQDRVRLYLPVSDLREPGDPAVLRTPQGEVDLRAEARQLRAGEQRTWTTTDGERLTLSNVVASGSPATTFAIGIGGPSGGGLEATFPLDGSGARKVDGEIDARLEGDLDGLGIDLDEDACAQLRRSPPTLLVEIVGPQGNGLRIRTR